MIVRIGFSGAMAHVRADAETQLGIFVNHLTIRRVLIEIGGQELFILEHFLHQLANFTSPYRTGVLF